MDEAEFQNLVAEAFEDPLFWGAQELAHALQLTDERRSTLNIKTIGSIDVSKRQRKKRRKVKDNEYQIAKLRAKGVKPRKEWLAEHTTNRDKPWLGLKISKATYYRRGLHLTQAGSETSVSAMKLVSNTCETFVSLGERKRREVPLQDMNLAKSVGPTPATEWREAA